MKNIAWFKEIGKEDVELAGGKGAQLGELYNANIPVPNGFVITTNAYKSFLEHARITKIIRHNLSNLNVENVQKLENTAKKLQKIIISASLPHNLQKDIVFSYNRIKGFVAVRSSATAEDLPTASFAGQQATYLNVNGDKEIIKAVKQCFASLFTARAIYYRAKNNFDHSKVLMAIVVQKMVNSRKAGVIFSINPLTNSNKEMVIESVFGLGESLVSGSVIPDSYIIQKKDGTIKEKQISEKEWGYFRERKKTVKRFLKGSKETLSANEVNELALLAKKIENHYNFPQDIEWAIDDKIYVVQTRSITTKSAFPKSKWRKILSREYGVQYTEISLRCLTPEAKDLVPYTFYEQVYIPEENNEVCYIGEEQWNKLIQNLKKRWNENNIKKFENLFMKTGKQYVNFSNGMYPKNLKNKSNKYLKSLYLKYQKLAVRYTSFIWTTFLLNDIFSEKAKNIIHKYIEGKDSKQKYYDAVFSPSKKASILKLASIVSRKQNITKKMMLELHNKFKWVSCLDIHNPPWNLNEFMQYVRQIRKKKQKSGISYQLILKKLKIKPKDKEVLATAKRFAYMKDLRDDFRRKAVYYAQISLFKELARRMKINLQDISYLQEKDIINFLDKGIKTANIKERQKGFVVFFDSNKDLACASGNKIKMTMRKLGLSIREGYSTEIKGVPASNGIAQGKVTIVKGVKDLYKVKKGDVLVAVTTHPDYVPAMQKAVAIVTNEGGMTSHAAIVAREFGVPCIVGTKVATKILKGGDMVEVDANIGIVRKLNK